MAKGEGSTSGRKSKRKLTPFLCQEMLYDFAVGRLDADRKAAVDEFLVKDKECQTILEGIRRGLAYTESLSRVELKPEVAANLRDSENAISLGRRYSSWNEWPEVLRWSITALGISAVVAGVVAVIPWGKLPAFRPKRSDTVEIASIPRPTDKQLEAAQEQQEIEPAAASADEGSGDDVIDVAEAPPQAPGSAVKVAARPPSEEDGEETAPATPPPSKPSPAGKPAAPVAVATAPISDEGEGEGQSEESEKKEAKAKGFVYRAFMNLSNLDEIGPKITEHVIELGGEKAGEVELGWKRGSGRYYHFAMPEENEEKLLEKLRAYGPVRISKDPHPRVMPQGQLRFILWVDAAR